MRYVYALQEDSADWYPYVQMIVDAESREAGDRLTVCRGERVEVDPYRDLRLGVYAVNDLADHACDDVSEAAGDWPKLTRDQDSRLDSWIRGAVKCFFENNGLKHDFFKVDNVVALEILVTEDGFEVL